MKPRHLKLSVFVTHLVCYKTVYRLKGYDRNLRVATLQSGNPMQSIICKFLYVLIEMHDINVGYNVFSLTIRILNLNI